MSPPRLREAKDVAQALQMHGKVLMVKHHTTNDVTHEVVSQNSLVSMLSSYFLH